MNNLSAYLQDAKKSALNGAPSHLILGNQSADMDSVASSICLAFNREGAIPLINIPKNELALRKDVEYMLQRLNINGEDLIYREDLSSIPYKEVTLVDHNALMPGQGALIPYVSEVIDHHKDEGEYYPNLISSKRLIRGVGSTATLIGELIPKGRSPEVALFLLAAILLDTSNLQNLAKTTPSDLAMAEQLQEQIKEPDLYSTLLSKKLEVDPSCIENLLKKDFKIYQEALLYGIASLPPELAFSLLWKERFRSFAKEQGLELLIAITQVEGKKSAIFYTPDHSKLKSLISHLAANSNLKDQMIFKEMSPDGFLFYDLSTPLPRKVFQPLLRLTSFPLIDYS